MQRAIDRAFGARPLGKIGPRCCWRKSGQKQGKFIAVLIEVSRLRQMFGDESIGSAFKKFTPNQSFDRREGKPQRPSEPRQYSVAVDIEALRSHAVSQK